MRELAYAALGGLTFFLGGMSGQAQERKARERPQVEVDQAPDVPKEPGKCALYWTHEHGNGGRSYQLTCAAPVPDSVVVFPGRVR